MLYFTRLCYRIHKQNLHNIELKFNCIYIQYKHFTSIKEEKNVYPQLVYKIFYAPQKLKTIYRFFQGRLWKYSSIPVPDSSATKNTKKNYYYTIIIQDKFILSIKNYKFDRKTNKKICLFYLHEFVIINI